MENKKGQGIFLGVVSVATLVVAIIGATFAFFSATATAGDGTIQGQTLGAQGGVLTLTATKITWADIEASSNDLVPTNITTNTAQNAVNAKCEAVTGVQGDNSGAKYTGCHFYRIVATAGSNIASANLVLSSFTLTNVTDSTKWHHAFYTTTDAAGATTYTLGTNVAAATDTGTVGTGTEETVFTSAMVADTPIVYYMIVYVENDEVAQNSGDSADVTGSYTGLLTLEVAGGNRVQASFSS